MERTHQRIVCFRILLAVVLVLVRGAIAERIHLPEVIPRRGLSVDSALVLRRSIREYSPAAVGRGDVVRLLWSGQGETNESGYRTAPSAGGLYPIDLYLVVRNVEDLATGVYRYIPGEHALEVISLKDIHRELGAAALDQEWVRDAALSIIVTGAPERTYVKYGERSWRYVLIESGCVVQNILLQATNLRLAAVLVGAFYDDKVRPLIGIGPTVHPLAIIAMGHRP